MMKQVKFKFPVRIAAILFGLFLSVGAFAQSITVNGHVKDATGEPIIGATVLVPGTSNGAATDLDGNFTLNCNQGDKLQVSYVGYATQTVTASSNLVVTLVEDSKVLNDVVVIGYGRAKKSDLTGSVTAIKPDEKNHGLQTNAQDMIQGKIAGVNITTSSGQPGSGATIRIRGGSSFNASNDPLIVIDGLAMDNQGVKGLSNPLSMVNPNDIESFTVLKDASATAIYGSRGSNGVIIITTKKGRKNMAPKVSYNGNVSLSLIKKYTDVLDGNEYRELVKEMYGEGSARYNLLGKENTDWQKQIYRTAISHDHNVTVQGGFANVPYRLSVGYTGQNGILKTSNFQRVTTSLNLSPSLLDDHLKFNINGKFMFAKNRYANSDAIGNAVSFDPTQPVTSSDARFSNFNGYWQWTQDAPYEDSAWPYSKIALATSNPVSMIEEKDDRANSYDYQGNVEVDYQIHGLEDLRLHMNFSGDWANGKQTTDYQPWGPSNFYYGNHGFTKENKYNLNYTAYIQYYKDFSEAHHFDIMGGYEWRHEKYWGNQKYYGLYPSTSAKAGEEVTPTKKEWKSEHYLVSFYGRMNYIALDRYMLTATLRADGSSRFGKGNKWGYFPSVALGWKINEEAFLKDVDAVTEMKLRLGWGMTGQQEGIGDYTYIPTYNQTQSSRTLYPIYSDGYQYKPDAYNPNVKWETTTTWNAGIDFGFIRNRLTGSIDFYHRKTKDLLMEAPVAGMSNFSNKLLKNIGSMQNTGVEFSITGRPIQTTDWNWEITANATYNKNKVVELAGDGQPIKFGNVEAFNNEVMCHQVGQPMSMFWVYQQVYDENGKPLQGVVVDRDANGVIDDADRYYYKSSVAPWLFGFSSRLSYKNWDFGFGLRASVGNYIYNSLKRGYRSKQYIGAGTGYMQNTMPYSYEVDFKQTSAGEDFKTDYFVENGSFLKCDNITLGYSFANLFKGGNYAGINGRVYVSASNVFTITKYKGLDPEVNGGIDGNIYPRPLTLLLGLSLNF
ncbi:MAG: TonB-dependent receptor [Prevotella sp.]|nr:TonB-dependent receptor [Prevotella sp.]